MQSSPCLGFNEIRCYWFFFRDYAGLLRNFFDTCVNQLEKQKLMKLVYSKNVVVSNTFQWGNFVEVTLARMTPNVVAMTDPPKSQEEMASTMYRKLTNIYSMELTAGTRKTGRYHCDAQDGWLESAFGRCVGCTEKPRNIAFWGSRFFFLLREMEDIGPSWFFLSPFSYCYYVQVQD